MKFPRAVSTRGKGFRATISTVEEALRFIDAELPAELKQQSRWIFARELLVVAGTTGKKRDITCAYRQVMQALLNDRLVERRENEAVALQASPTSFATAVANHPS